MILGQDLAIKQPASKSGLPYVFVNKVLLEHSHNYLFTYRLWMLLYYNAEMNFWNGTYGPQNLKYLLSGPLQKKKMPIPRLGRSLSFLRFSFPTCKIWKFDYVVPRNHVLVSIIVLYSNSYRAASSHINYCTLRYKLIHIFTHLIQFIKHLVLASYCGKLNSLREYLPWRSL